MWRRALNLERDFKLNWRNRRKMTKKIMWHVLEWILCSVGVFPNMFCPMLLLKISTYANYLLSFIAVFWLIIIRTRFPEQPRLLPQSHHFFLSCRPHHHLLITDWVDLCRLALHNQVGKNWADDLFWIVSGILGWMLPEITFGITISFSSTGTIERPLKLNLKKNLPVLSCVC